MKAYTFDRENKTIKVQKDCKKCLHINVCVFHKNMSDLAKTNTMYKMTEYAENNNLMHIFDIYGLCHHYSPVNVTVVGESPNLSSDREIINEVVYANVKVTQESLLKEKYPEHVDNIYFFFSPSVSINVKDDVYTLKLQTTDKTIGHGTVILEETFSISDLLSQWKFIK